ncbi:MAG: MBOAT family protein, partial [Ruthenibacterium sp.]
TSAALGMLRNLFSQWNVWIFTDGSLYTLGLDAKDFWLAALAIVIMLCVDLCREHGVGLYARLQRQNIVVRWAVYYAAIFCILIFGVYGIGYDASQFIYFQF